MIEFKNVTIKYKKKTICEDISFDAKDGELTVLLGKNGSGKSSLLKAALGLVKYSGEIKSEGRIAYMPQLLPQTEMTVEELVMCGRVPMMGLGAIPSEEDKAEVEKIIEETQLSDLAAEKVSLLSGGERQRAYFAMMIAEDAKTILLDEPTANLDSEYRQMVYDYIERFKTEGRAVLLVMHHPSESRRIADKIVEIK